MKRGRLLSPQYWLVWLGLAFVRALALLPFGMRLRIGAALGTAARWGSPQHVRVARRNLELCLPDLTAPERERVLRAHFRSLGMTIPETTAAWWMSHARLRAQSELRGLEHLDAVLASGQGAILLAAHFTTLEIAASILAAYRPVRVVYKRTKNPLLTEIITAHRGAKSRGAIASDEIATSVRALRKGEVVWYAPDQAFRKKGAEMVPFFGLPTATNTATSRLAQLTGARVLPFFAERLTDLARYRVTIHPPLEAFPSGDSVDDTRRFHELIEAQVRAVPEQYLWVHRRFKGLTEDYPDYYGAAAPSGGRPSTEI